MSSETNQGVPESKNRGLAQIRQFHKWGGVIAATLLLILGTTGIVLNYKQPIFARLRIETKRAERDASPLPASKSTNQIQFNTSAGISGGAIDFAGALALARAEWSEVPLERVEMRAERGSVSYRFRKSGGAEFWVDAADGTHLAKSEYERIGKPGADGVPTRQTDWGKILIDLHTGRVGGDIGKAVVSCGAALLLLLTLSGLYMWVKPIFIRRQTASTRHIFITRSTSIKAASRNPERELVES
jgi:hypothetical protein